MTPVLLMMIKIIINIAVETKSTANWGGLGHCGEWGQKTVSFLFLQYFLKQNYFLGGNGMDCLISVRCLGLAKERFFLTQFSAFFFLL